MKKPTSVAKKPTSVAKKRHSVAYTSGPSQTIFGYTQKIFAAADLKVYLTPVGATPNPSADLLTLTTEYTVSNVGSDGGGNVTLVTPATTGDIITIERAKKPKDSKESKAEKKK